MWSCDIAFKAEQSLYIYIYTDGYTYNSSHKTKYSKKAIVVIIKVPTYQLMKCPPYGITIHLTDVQTAVRETYIANWEHPHFTSCRRRRHSSWSCNRNKQPLDFLHVNRIEISEVLFFLLCVTTFISNI